MNLHNQMQQLKRKNGEIDITPKQNMEYIYTHDMYWTQGPPYDHIELSEHKIVVNVKLNNGQYTFEFKDFKPGTYRCNYGWAFVENTEEGRYILRQIELEREKLKKQEAILSVLHAKLPKLYHRS